MFPVWFHLLSIAGLALGVACAAWMLLDVVRRPQKMMVMSVVWPVTALFGTLFTVWGYMRFGRADPPGAASGSGSSGSRQKTADQPFAAIVGKGALHCGAGCMIGDLLAEWLAFLVPAVAVAFGWKSIFDDKIFAVWVLDFAFAFVLGIVFQYFAIKPMRNLSPGAGIVAAVKADALSLASWQIGMYGLMAIAQFALLPYAFGHRAEVDTAEFWFVMQVAMLAGFLTAYPVNWWLIRSGIKEKM